MMRDVTLKLLSVGSGPTGTGKAPVDGMYERLSFSKPEISARASSSEAGAGYGAVMPLSSRFVPVRMGMWAAYSLPVNDSLGETMYVPSMVGVLRSLAHVSHDSPKLTTYLTSTGTSMSSYASFPFKQASLSVTFKHPTAPSTGVVTLSYKSSIFP